MMVDLPEPEGPTSAVTVSGRGMEGDTVEDGPAGGVGETHVVESDVAVNRPERDRAVGIFIFRRVRAGSRGCVRDRRALR